MAEYGIVELTYALKQVADLLDQLDSYEAGATARELRLCEAVEVLELRCRQTIRLLAMDGY